MKLRQLLLDHLQRPGYRPTDEAGLVRALGLGRKQRGSLAHEVRRLLASGVAVRGSGGAVRLRDSAPERSGARSRPRATSRSKPAPRAREGTVGVIQFRAGGSAYVLPEGPAPAAAPVQISAEDTGTALPGDRVVVQLYPGRSGRRAGETVGRVVQVLERGRDTVVGELRRHGHHFIVAADDPRFVPEVHVADPARSGLRPRPAAGDKVVVRLEPWESRRQPVTGALVERLGRTFEPRAELLGVFAKFDLAPEFPEAVTREASALPDHVRPGDRKHRQDCRRLPVLTIDPDDAKDFDDALSLETLPDGGARVGVHIADVSAYVKPGTALDREAQQRGNSTYLVGTVVPMLPERLSNGLCSLVEGQDRLCKAAFLTFAPNGRLTGADFANTVIRSRKRLTYRQAYALLFENDLGRVRALPLPPKHQTGSTGRALNTLSDAELRSLQDQVRRLWELARRLRRDRFAHGSLDLDMPETKIYVDAEGYADRLEKIEQDESHQLIEEFMLAANEAVAHLTRRRKLPALYRVHDEPDAERLNELRQLLGTHGFRVSDLSQRPEVVKLLETLRTHPQGYTLRTQLLRSLRKACYRAAPDGHYGLHKKDYTHFTSPIRRYADLVVHRVLDRELGNGRPAAGPASRPPGYDRATMEKLATHLSLTEINSAEAERESVKIKLLEFFEREAHRQPRTRFAAVITDVRRHGFFIELVESMTFGLVPAATLRDDHYLLNQAGTSLVGRRHHRKFELNGRLDVVVHQVDRFRRTIDFRPA